MQERFGKHDESDNGWTVNQVPDNSESASDLYAWLGRLFTLLLDHPFVNLPVTARAAKLAAEASTLNEALALADVAGEVVALWSAVENAARQRADALCGEPRS